MIIPVQEVTCGKMLSDKWKVYVEMINDPKKPMKNTISIHISDYTKKSKELQAFEKLGIRVIVVVATYYLISN